MRASETSPRCVKPFRERDCSTPTLQVSVANLRTGRAGSALSPGMTSEPRQEGSPVVELKLIVMRITNNVDYNRKPRLPSGGNRPSHVHSIVPSKTKRSALDLQVRVCCTVSTLNARATLGVELIPADLARHSTLPRQPAARTWIQSPHSLIRLGNSRLCASCCCHRPLAQVLRLLRGSIPPAGT